MGNGSHQANQIAQSAPLERALLWILNGAVIGAVRPYVRRELPGWGYLYRLFVGTWRRDWFWKYQRERWVTGKLHGYQMSVRITGWSNRSTFFLERFYDLPTQLVIKKLLKKGDTFIDIGANEGMMSLVASDVVGEGGKVIAFEPSPVPREIFERAIERNGIGNIDLRPVGLSDAEGNSDLFVPDVNSGEGSFTKIQGLTGKTVSCPVRIGDSTLFAEQPALMKIDVEGFERHVLQGLTETIKRAKPAICIEMVTKHLARDGETPGNIIIFFETLGYRGERISLRRHGRHFELELSPMSDAWVDGDYLFSPIGASGVS